MSEEQKAQMLNSDNRLLEYYQMPSMTTSEFDENGFPVYNYGQPVSEADALKALQADLKAIGYIQQPVAEPINYTGYIPQGGSLLPSRTMPQFNPTSAQTTYSPPAYTGGFSVPALNTPTGAPAGTSFKYKTGRN
jgi:hypothetical protein